MALNTRSIIRTDSMWSMDSYKVGASMTMWKNGARTERVNVYVPLWSEVHCNGMTWVDATTIPRLIATPWMSDSPTQSDRHFGVLRIVSRSRFALALSARSHFMSHNARSRFVLTQWSHSADCCCRPVSIGVKSWSFCLHLTQQVASRHGGC